MDKGYLDVEYGSLEGDTIVCCNGGFFVAKDCATYKNQEGNDIVAYWILIDNIYGGK